MGQGKSRQYPTALWDTISTIKPSKRGRKDKRIWLNNSSGDYSARTWYYTALADRQDPNIGPPVEHQWIKEIWNLVTAPKIKIFIWKIKQGALHIGTNIAYRGITTHSNCVHCGERETILHIFYQCAFAKEVWECLPVSNSEVLGNPSSFSGFWTRTLQLVPLPPTGLGIASIAPWVAWSIWITRNFKIFQDRHFSS